MFADVLLVQNLDKAGQPPDNDDDDDDDDEDDDDDDDENKNGEDEKNNSDVLLVRMQIWKVITNKVTEDFFLSSSP